MGISEFQQHFGNITSENFTETIANWLRLPVYTELPIDLRAKIESISTLRGAVRAFTEQHRVAAYYLVKTNKHFEAMRLVDQRLQDVKRIFMADDLITARMFAYRRRGWIQEHLATFGEMSKYPLGDSMRTLCFLGGAMDYMKGDLELGCATDYGIRAGECLGGAGMHELASATAVKLFGGNVAIMGANSVDALIIKDLARRAIEAKTLGPIPGSRDAQMLTIKDPNTEVN